VAVALVLSFWTTPSWRTRRSAWIQSRTFSLAARDR
jgi:hypothetical protein